MSTVFQAVRENVTARQAAELCKLNIDRAGYACCPFHDDHKPSLKLDERFHCFGCGADGDAIGLVARYYKLSPIEAAAMLAEAFGIPYENGKGGPAARVRAGRLRKKTADPQREKTERGKLLEIAESRFFLSLLRAYGAMKRAADEREPQKRDEEPDELWSIAVRDLPIVEDLFDTYLAASAGKRLKIMKDHGREVVAYEERFARA